MQLRSMQKERTQMSSYTYLLKQEMHYSLFIVDYIYPVTFRMVLVRVDKAYNPLSMIFLSWFLTFETAINCLNH